MGIFQIYRKALLLPPSRSGCEINLPDIAARPLEHSANEYGKGALGSPLNLMPVPIYFYFDWVLRTRLTQLRCQNTTHVLPFSN